MTTDNSSFLSNTLKRRQQKRQEVAKVLQEGISSLHLSSPSSDQQSSQTNERIYPLLNVDPDSYVLDEGDERAMLEPHSSHNPEFKQMIDVLLNWINTSLHKDSIIIRSFEDDFYDGYILGKLIEYHQPNIRLLHEGIPLSEEMKKQTLQRVLTYIETSSPYPMKWTFEQIYHRNLIAILHLLLTLMKLWNIPTRTNLPKNLFLKIVVVKKINGLLQTRIVNECFIEDHQHEEISPRQGDLIDALFDLAPDKLQAVEKLLINFINQHLIDQQIQIKRIHTEDFQDGLYLVYLISHLENYFPILNKYHQKKPLTREQIYGNFQLVFQLLTEGNVRKDREYEMNWFSPLVGMDIEQYCRINDLLTGNERSLYRLLFQMYLRYHSEANYFLQSITYLQPIRTEADSPFL